jgi:F-box interacting protein
VEKAYIFDDLPTGRWSSEFPMCTWHGRWWGNRNDVVGTCNGIVCMVNDFGGVVLHNPITGETLAVPSLTSATGRYKVVHVPRCSRGVRVFTLGNASWQHLATDGWWCYPEDGFVTIHNTMYWAVEMKDGGVNIICLDLDGERVPTVIPLPPSRPAATFRLTVVHGIWLGVIFSLASPQRLDKTEVWVLKQHVWTSYSVQVRHPPRHRPQWHDHQHLTSPHFAHDRDGILTWEWLPTGGGCALYRHDAASTEARPGTVEIDERNQGTMVAHFKTEYDTFQTFDYVETREPLSVYKRW